MKKIEEIFSKIKKKTHGLNQFTQSEIEKIENSLFKKKDKFFLKCLIRQKNIVAKPEEIVRQLYISKLLKEYNYPIERINVEYSISFGTETKKADIVIFDKIKTDVEYVIIEVKKPTLLKGKDQLKSYCNATGAPVAVWTNGDQISYYNRKDPNYFESISNLPSSNQKLIEIVGGKFNWKDLILKDRILTENISLKQIILEMEDEVLANAGVDVFEEVFKLIFCKLFDEMESRDDKIHFEKELNKSKFENQEGYIKKVKDIDDSGYRDLLFRNKGETESELYQKIDEIFNEAKNTWKGIFLDDDKINLTQSHLSICVSSLQDIKLFNSNLQIIDEAFEYLVKKTSKGEKGQFFTPRHVIDMCVKMIDPKKGETMIDPASGSCGFPVHTIFHFTKKLFENKELSKEEKKHVLNIFAIDFDPKVVRLSRTLNLIAGDGESNVMLLNTLDYERWNEKLNDRSWFSTYGKGVERLEKLKKNKNSFKEFNFDILMANPPFAGKISESRIIHKYNLGYNEKRKVKSKVSRDILFVERCVDFLKPGGRMAIVLPQGRLNNLNDKMVRDYLFDKGKILAVIGLDSNTFKPHTGTKTSVIIFQKWNEDKNLGPVCKKTQDYEIFFAVSNLSGKNNKGEYVYLLDNYNKHVLDNANHSIVLHDLHNHDGFLKDGIAEKYLNWRNKNK